MNNYTLLTSFRTLLTVAILEKLGEGNGGIAYKAHDLKNDRFVVIKELSDNNVNELSNYLKLNYLPYIPKLYDHFDNYLVIELIDGLELGRHTDLYKSWAYCWKILRRLIETVNQLHQYGFYHGDVRADNIIISDRVVLIDLEYCEPINDSNAKSDIIILTNVFEYIYSDDGYINDNNGQDRYCMLRDYCNSISVNSMNDVLIEYDRIDKLRL